LIRSSVLTQKAVHRPAWAFRAGASLRWKFEIRIGTPAPGCRARGPSPAAATTPSSSSSSSGDARDTLSLWPIIVFTGNSLADTGRPTRSGGRAETTAFWPLAIDWVVGWPSARRRAPDSARHGGSSWLPAGLFYVSTSGAIACETTGSALRCSALLCSVGRLP
jgi:hypothetical protein